MIFCAASVICICKLHMRSSQSLCILAPCHVASALDCAIRASLCAAIRYSPSSCHARDRHVISYRAASVRTCGITPRCAASVICCATYRTILYDIRNLLCHLHFAYDALCDPLLPLVECACKEQRYRYAMQIDKAHYNNYNILCKGK